MLICGLGGYLAQSRLGHAVVCWSCGRRGAWQPGGIPTPAGASGPECVAFMSIAWVAGTIIRRAVVRARFAEDRAVQLEQEQAEAARQAVSDERQRIARELHDIIAHSVSVMTVQTGAVRRRLTPEQSRERELARRG